MKRDITPEMIGRYSQLVAKALAHKLAAEILSLEVADEVIDEDKEILSLFGHDNSIYNHILVNVRVELQKIVGSLAAEENRLFDELPIPFSAYRLGDAEEVPVDPS